MAAAHSLSLAAFRLFMEEDLLQTREVQRQVYFRCEEIDQLTNTDIDQSCPIVNKRFLEEFYLFVFAATAKCNFLNECYNKKNFKTITYIITEGNILYYRTCEQYTLFFL